MNISEVKFVGSFERVDDCPSFDIPEYSFIGRSNVGKSSLINALTNRKEIAKVSHTPGKTKTINYFEVDQNWGLVDLPGYGYAQISKKSRRKWQMMIHKYLTQRSQLLCTFVLLDSRHPLQQIDLDFINKLGEKGIPFVLVYTKIDRVKESDREKNINEIRVALLEHWNVLPKEFITSATKRKGVEQIIAYIGDLNQIF